MKKAIIVDFDLTFVNINSFEFFYKELISYTIKERYYKCIVKLLWLIIIRKLRIISHADLKRYTLNLCYSISYDHLISLFIEKLKTHINKKVLLLCEEYQRNNYSIYLCTAAPELYIKPFLQILNFRFNDFICTTKPIEGIAWKENISENKKQSIMKLLHDRSEILAILITDHYDDLPLLKIKKEKNILVNPTQKTIQLSKKNNIKFSILRY